MTMFDPFREIEALRRDIDHAFGDGFRMMPRFRFGFLPGRAARQYPLVNLYDEGENILVEALMPGVEPDQMDVTVVGNLLTLSGQKPGLGNLSPERIHRNERAGGRFMRTISLAAEVERDQVSAEYKHGLLLLKMPRAESSKPRRVLVQAGSQ